MALRPDSFCEWAVKNQMAELAQEDVAEMMRFWYERAVDEQKKELREFKKKVKAQTQLPKVEPIPLTVEDIEEELPQGDRLEAIKA
jgi:hypothetical protein